MSRSPSVLRRYTPPTCTLEVLAQDSALSRWATQPVLKDLRFRLSLDDPKLPEEQWRVVNGDRVQLDALCDAVSTYVQTLLESSDRLMASGADAAATTSVEPTSDHAIFLQPQGLLTHKVHWGSLADSEAPSQLSTLQLFDLANALDAYSAEVLTLPTLDRRSWLSPVPNWAQIAAVVLIAVGLSTSLVKLLDSSNMASAPTTSQTASSNDQTIPTQLPPAVVEKATPPAVSTQPLPSPSPGSSPTPQPGLPKVVTPKSPQVDPAPVTLQPGTIATYPVPEVPGSPTIISGEAASTRSKRPDPSQVAAAPQTADASSVDANRQRGINQAPASSAAGSTAFDTIPQVAEARTYFRQRWKPPAGLTQILEYSLQVSADGTIRSITPLRQAAGDYIDRTGMPLLGDPFVSPLQGKQSAKIRLVLEPDGQVQTFLVE